MLDKTTSTQKLTILSNLKHKKTPKNKLSYYYAVPRCILHY